MIARRPPPLLFALALASPAAAAPPLDRHRRAEARHVHDTRWQRLGLYEARYITPWDTLHDPRPARAARHLDGGRARVGHARAARLRALAALGASCARTLPPTGASRASSAGCARAIPTCATGSSGTRRTIRSAADREPAPPRRAVLRDHGPQLPRLPDRRRRRARHQQHDELGPALRALRHRAPAHLGPAQLRRHEPAQDDRHPDAAADHRHGPGLVHGGRRPRRAARVRRRDGEARVPLLPAPRGARDAPRLRARVPEPAHPARLPLPLAGAADGHELGLGVPRPARPECARPTGRCAASSPAAGTAAAVRTRREERLAGLGDDVVARAAPTRRG